MAKFFNSIWFKCVSVLLVLSVVIGATLAILNDVLYVTPEERTARAITKIYGEEKDFDTVLDIDDKTRTDSAINYSELGSINKIYTINSDKLFQVTGYNGYKGGTITLWIKVSTDANNHMKIDKIVLESYEKQTLMSKLDGSFYGGFYVDVTEAYENGSLFTPVVDGDGIENPISGATKSANAACSAVNCVIKYLGGE